MKQTIHVVLAVIFSVVVVVGVSYVGKAHVEKYESRNNHEQFTNEEQVLVNQN